MRIELGPRSGVRRYSVSFHRHRAALVICRRHSVSELDALERLLQSEAGGLCSAEGNIEL
jgi:hypothetical protein